MTLPPVFNEGLKAGKGKKTLSPAFPLEGKGDNSDVRFLENDAIFFPKAFSEYKILSLQGGVRGGVNKPTNEKLNFSTHQHN